MSAPRPGFLGPLGPLPGTAAAMPSSRVGGRRSSTSTRRPGRGAPHVHPLRASATPPAGPATASARPAAATDAGAPSRRGRPEGGAAAPPSPPQPSSSAKRRSTGTASSPSAAPSSSPPAPPPLTSAAAADAASRAAAAAYTANLGTVIETLRSDYPHLLTRPPVGSIYTPDVAFVSAGVTTSGEGAYGALWWAVRSVARLLLVGGEVAITSLYADAAAGRVYVRWRLTGVLRGGAGGGGGDVGGDGGGGGWAAAAAEAATSGLPRVGGGWGAWPGGAGGGPPLGAAAGGGGGRRLVRDGMSVYTVGATGLVTKHELIGTSPTRSRLSTVARGGVVDLWGGVLAGGGVGGGRLAGAGSGVGAGGGGRGWRHDRRRADE